MNRFFLPLLFFATTAGAQSVKLENNQLVTAEAVVFTTGTANLKPESEATLRQVAQFLKEKSYVSLLRIEGHAVAETEAESLSLSGKRAVAVGRWLQAQGIDCKRLLPVAFGDTKPVVAPDAVEKARNTRITFTIAAVRNRPVGGLPVDGGGQATGDLCQ